MKEELKNFLFSKFNFYSKESILYEFFNLDDQVIDVFFECFTNTLVANNYSGVLDYGLDKIKQGLMILNCSLDNFYSLYLSCGYLKEEVQEVFNDDKMIYKTLLYRKYGENLSENIEGDFSLDEMKLIYRTVPAYMFLELSKYRKEHSLIGIDDLFEGSSLEDIKKGVNSLKVIDRRYFYDIFGGNLTNKIFYKRVNKLNRRALFKLADSIKSGRKTSRRPSLKDFYLLIDSARRFDESILEFRLRVSEARLNVLNDREKEILLRAYGEKLNEINTYDVSLDEVRYIKSEIVPKIILYLKPIETTEMYDSLVSRFLGFFPVNDVKEAISVLSPQEKLQLFAFSDFMAINRDDKDYYEKMNQKKIKDLIKVLAKVELNLLKEKSRKIGISTKKLREIFVFTKGYEFLHLCNKYGYDLALAIIIKIRFREIRQEKAQLLTGISDEESTSYAKDYLIREVIGVDETVSLDDISIDIKKLIL